MRIDLTQEELILIKVHMKHNIQDLKHPLREDQKEGNLKLINYLMENLKLYAKLHHKVTIALRNTKRRESTTSRNLVTSDQVKK